MSGYRLARCLDEKCGWMYGGDKADAQADKHTLNHKHPVLTVTKERMFG